MWDIFKFELIYRAKRPATYIYFFILFLMAFCAITTDVISVGGSAGQVKENAPTTITFFFIILSVIPGVLLASAVMGVPILRDFEHKTASMIFTSPINKYQYLGGRFLGSLVVTTFIFFGMFLGMVLGYAIGAPLGWVDTEKLLPFNFMHMLQPFLIFVIPNIFIMGCLFFASGALSRKLMMVYVQGILLFMFYAISGELMEDMDNQNMAALLDPFGIGTNDHYTRYWTVAEKNTMTVPFSGLILWNRLLWCGLALLTLLFTFWKFDFNLVGKATKKQRKNAILSENAPSAKAASMSIPVVEQFSGFKTQLGQLWDLSIFYFKWLVNQPAFLAIAGCGLIFTTVGFFFGLGGMYGVDVYPTTYRVIELLADFNIFFLIITIFYSGELIWKERDVKINQIYDALPYPNWVTTVGKFLGLTFVFFLLLGVLTLIGIIAQLVLGFSYIQFGTYFIELFINQMSRIVLYAFIGFFFHTIVNQKFLGHAMYAIFFIVNIVMIQLGVEHRMFVFGSNGFGDFSEMNGFGHYFQTLNWFNTYWFGLAFVLFGFVQMFWVRGNETGFWKRLSLGRLRLDRSLITFLFGALVIFISTGSFIYYNTNVINEYQNSEDQNADRAAYEKTLKKYENETLLKIVGTYVEIDIRPETRDFIAKGKYVLKNKSDQPIDKIYLQTNANHQITDAVKFNVPTTSVEKWDNFHFEVLSLNTPVASGDSIEMEFTTNFKTEGFVEGGSNTEILHNGTFFNNNYFPTFGYNDGFELSNEDDRKENDLPKKNNDMRDRDDPIGLSQNLFGGVSDQTRFEIKLSTSPNQIAIAPGYLQKEWEADGRRHFHYKMDKPIANFYSIVSADYEVKKEKWTNGKQEVNLEIYYNKGHEYNLDRMFESMRHSLDYFTENFSPYQYRQLRIMEFPRYRSFAQSFSNTVPFSEEIGFMLNVQEDDVDVPYYVTSHEIAHQWWGHQVTEANVKGSAMSSETMAQYSALMVMKKHYPEATIQRYLKEELDRYLGGRSGESKKENSLHNCQNQSYLHYRKGSLSMYALQDYISEDSVNLALRRIIEKWANTEGRYVTTDDYLEEFRKVTPDSLQYIIEDLFETITLFENRTKEATYTKSGDEYTVNIDVSAIKYRADSLGNENKVPIDDWIEIGVLGEDENGKDKVLYLQKHKVNKEEMSFEVKVNELPKHAGIDPINKLVDRNPEDNRKTVVEK